MALSTSTVWETRASGAGVSDSNGGAYAPLTVSTFTGTDLVVDGTVNTKVTAVSHSFVAADVNGRIFITAGTGWTAGFYTITSVAAGAANLSASPAPVGTTGGSWVLTGQDYSQQNSPQVTVGTGNTTSITANVITFTGYAPTVADVGNVVQMLTGTNVTAGFYQITAFTATTWTVTGAATLPTSGTTTNATGNMGGALLTLAKLAGAMLTSNKAFVTGAFTATATTTFGQAAAAGTAAAPLTRLIGYGATRGDGTHATLSLTTNVGLTGIAITNGFFILDQIDVDCGSLGTSTGISSAGASTIIMRCKASNFASAGISLVATSGIVSCEATGGIAGAAAGLKTTTVGTVLRCDSHDNACPGIAVSSNSVVVGNLVTNNSGATSDGISIGDRCSVIGNTVHNSGRHGIADLGSVDVLNNWANNLLTNNGSSGTGFGIAGNTSAVPASFLFDGNAYFSNASGNRSNMDAMTGQFGVNPFVNVRDVILSVSPYVGPTTGASANFALNSTSGGGAACKKAGAPSTWPGNTGTSSFPDLGAAQSSGGGVPGIVVASA